MAFDDSHIDSNTSSVTDMAVCIGLDQALRLSTQFSVHSNSGEIPGDLEVPIPMRANCTFVIKPWGAVSESEREAFRRFYVRVGEELEDLAHSARDGGIIDEHLWHEITGQLLSTDPMRRGR